VGYRHQGKSMKARASMQTQGGFSLIEVLLAMVLVGILGVAIPGALSTANVATIVSGEHTMAESLARSQMDYIQNQTYDKTNNPPVYAVLPNLPANYGITRLTMRLDPKGDGIANDDGLQQIAVTIMRDTRTIYTLVDFKVNLNR
jgi:prepilin-type N-terminal cleavage/methylation domain-containing protein